MNIKAKSTQETALEQQTYQIFPDDLNPMGTLFAGRVMSLMDITAYTIATAHCGYNCVTAHIDNIDFILPAKLGDKILLYGSINRAWRTSMEVGVKVCKQSMYGGEVAQILKAYFIMVALDASGKPVPVPEIILSNETEERRFAEAQLRRDIRMNR